MDIDLQDNEVSSSSSSSTGSSSGSSSCSSDLLKEWDSSSASSVGAADLLGFFSEDESNEKPARKDRVCIKNYCENVIPFYSDKSFIRKFRLDRATVNNLIIRYSESKYCVFLNSGGRPPVPPHKQIYAFLWYVGHQMASYDEVEDRFDLSSSTVHNIITKVSNFLGDIAPEYIKWPTEEEIECTKDFYLHKYNFKDVIASLDGTHIKIDRPPQQQSSYYNRKDFFSLQMQVLSDHNYKIIDFHLGYPGSVHDAKVFKNSPLYERITTTNIGNGYILGDSAYPCLKQLMTPFKNNGHLETKHKKFNLRLSKCRVSVEQTIGQLKQRFRILYHLHIKPGMRRLKIIRACCVLHNMCNESSVQYLEDPLEPYSSIDQNGDIIQQNSSDSSDDEMEHEDFQQDGFGVRDTLCDTLANVPL